VSDENNEEVGVSKIAAKKAVYLTAFSRVFMSFPILAIPGVAMMVIEKAGLMPKTTRMQRML
jgi:hypothetical protein